MKRDCNKRSEVTDLEVGGGVYLIEVGSKYTYHSPHNWVWVYVQCTSDIVATLGHHFLATISDWPLYPT